MSEPETAPSAPAPPEATPAAASSLWWEVAAVLAVGVIPHQMNAFVAAATGASLKLPYWLDTVDLCVRSACVAYAVLYVIGRSGEPWSAFGLARPRPADLGLGIVIFAADTAVFTIVARSLPADIGTGHKFFPVPTGADQYAMMALKCAANAFAEELVVRAYLITRLERLLKSRVQAVAVSTLLFASYHAYYGPGGELVSIAVTGLVFGALYMWVRRVWPFALAHALIGVVAELNL